MTGDGAVRELLADADPRTAVTAQQARSIGISPATAAKLSALLQRTQGQLEAANDRCTKDPSPARAAELRNCRRSALTARDVVRGQRPLAVLDWYRAPLDGHGTDRLFTPDEVEQAQLHFDAAATCDPQVAAGVRAEPQNLCSVNSVITAQQAQGIGVTMNTAAKLSAFINDAAERHAAATVISRTDPIGAIPELNRSLRLHTAGMQVACGH